MYVSKQSLLISALSMLVATAVNAAPLYEGWTSARALGMGNAFTAVASGSDAIFYNSAALADVSGLNWTIADPRVGASGQSALQAYQNYQQTSNVSALLEGLYGQTAWLGGGGKSAVALPYFGFAAFSNADTAFRLSNPAYPTADLGFLVDYGFAASIAAEPIADILRFGATVKRINRTGAQLMIPTGTLAQLNTALIEAQLKNRGSGVGVDLSAELTLPSSMAKPTLAMTWHDVGSTTFSHDEGLNAPPTIASNLTVGAALDFTAPGLHLIPAIDCRYADRSDIPLGKKLSLGLELDLLIFTVRGGINQGYYTVGAGLNIGVARVDVATYGVELGAYAGQLQDRRYVAQLSFELDFDVSSYIKANRGKARLKQRR